MLTLKELEDFGVDVKEGLNRCMNNEGFYLKMVKMGVSNEYFDSLGKYLESGKLDEAFEAAHALKGVIGNLALSPIYDPLAELTELLREKQEGDYAGIYKTIKERRNALLSMCQS